MAFYITGDTHGDFRRFGTSTFPAQKTLTKQDYVIICGDFGFWDDSKNDRYWLNWLQEKPFTTLFVGGNHENYDALAKIPAQDWNGGRVQFVRESVIHLLRGQVFDIGGKRFFTMGGASSHDIKDGILDPNAPDFKFTKKALDLRNAMYRINHVSWWAEELPSDEEYETARRKLDACGWKVDCIVSHCAPTGVAKLLGYGRYPADRLTEFFQELSERCDFRHWFFGHYHDHKTVRNKFHLLYEQIVTLPTTP